MGLQVTLGLRDIDWVATYKGTQAVVFKLQPATRNFIYTYNFKWKTEKAETYAYSLC